MSFLGHTAALPLFISCMTGGSERGFQVNKDLARAAQRTGIPVGTGSIRILFEEPGLARHFQLKKLAPDVPVLANIGAVQVRDLEQKVIVEMVNRIEAQSLVVHLNPGQELFQPEGDRDYRGLTAAIARLCEASRVPIIVKETGFGVLPSTIRELLDAGVSYVDVAGSGGTNWISVESYRLPEEERKASCEFSDWGIPTALLLAAAKDHTGRIMASGGIRTGMETAKAVALGAEMAGMALPFLRAVATAGVENGTVRRGEPSGEESVVQLIRRIEKVLRSVMVLTGSRRLPDLRNGKMWEDPAFSASVKKLSEIDRQ